jgi:hypothetical protein
MKRRNDIHTEMRNLLLDRDTLERLLAGRVAPDDAPPGYAEVARVLQAAAALSDHTDLSHEAENIAAARLLVTRSPASGRPHAKPKTMPSKAHRLKLVGLVVLGTLVGTSGLAAAGMLPDTAQDVLSSVLGHLGMSVPQSDHPTSSGDRTPGVSTTSKSAEVGRGAAISGIATRTDSVGVDKGAEISSTASDGKSQAGEQGSGAGKGAEVSEIASGGKSHAGEQGSGAGKGAEIAEIASGGRGNDGTDIADERSDGRSAAGSGNRTSGRGH